MKLFRKLRLLLFIIKNIYKITKTNSYVLLTDMDDKDKRDLALGRWAQYKLMYVPEFNVKMDKDDESSLFFHTFMCINGGKKLSPDQLLEQCEMAIKICTDAYESGKSLKKYLEVLPQGSK